MPDSVESFGGRPPKEFAQIEEIQIAEWCPTPDSSGPPEMVVMVIRVRGLDLPLMLRMKTGPAVDAVIDPLVKYRESVFGKR